ncbi:MAG: GIN domain-containing protein, partial [Bacteroidota bacterium]
NDVGVVDASGLSTAYTFIRSSSTGKAEVEVEKELLADISHTGNIYYSGPVNMINSTVTGSGRLIRR